MSTTRWPWRRSRALGMRVATALAALLLTGGMVLRMSAPLASSSPAARASISSNGVLELVAGRETPLFDRVVLSPGQPVSACVRVSANSPDDPAPISLSLQGYEGSAVLAAATQVIVEFGYEAEDDPDCAGFVPEALVAAGALAELAEDRGDSGRPLRTNDPLPGSSDVWYRLTLLLPESVAGAVRGEVVEQLSLLWASSVAAPADAGLRQRVIRVLGGVAEHSVVPLMVMLVIAVMFLGIQNRIDRRDPKLAAAPIVRGSLAFRPPEAAVRAPPPGPARAS